MDLLLVILLGVIVVAVTTATAQRVGVAGPLVLVALGLGVSLLPFVPAIDVPPELILVGVLPPLLYSAAVQLPAIEFRRDITPIAGLSVILVVVSSVILGLFFTLVIPGLGLALGIALGAILSPTDAVATSIAKRLGLSPRVVTLLEGESLLNDATALVLLRTAIAAIAAGFSFGAATWAFVWGVVLALIIGGIIGFLSLRLRRWVRGSAANTAIGFTIPFLAYIPTEHFGGSGLVAAVVAGLVTGQGASRWLTPDQRLSDAMNWRTIELVLEGAVFLIMGLELKEIVRQNFEDHQGIWHGSWLAVAALGIILAVRAVYVSLLIVLQRGRSRRVPPERLDAFSAHVDRVESGEVRARAPLGKAASPEQQARRIGRVRTRIARMMADVEYYRSSPLDWRHGTVIVWAGMRGVVTLAAAQTLPADGSVENRALLIFVAFLVAILSLLVQGFTLPGVVRLVGLQGSGSEGPTRHEQDALDAQLREAAAAALAHDDLRKLDGTPFPTGLVEKFGTRLTEPPDDETTAMARDALELRLHLIEAMRRRLTEVSRGGQFSTAALRHAMAELDADQLSLEIRITDEQ